MTMLYYFYYNHSQKEQPKPNKLPYRTKPCNRKLWHATKHNTNTGLARAVSVY